MTCSLGRLDLLIVEFQMMENDKQVNYENLVTIGRLQCEAGVSNQPAMMNCGPVLIMICYLRFQLRTPWQLSAGGSAVLRFCLNFSLWVHSDKAVRSSRIRADYGPARAPLRSAIDYCSVHLSDCATRRGGDFLRPPGNWHSDSPTLSKLWVPGCQM